MFCEVQNDNTLCNPLVCPLSDRAVGKFEKLKGESSDPMPFQAEGFGHGLRTPREEFAFTARLKHILSATLAHFFRYL